MEENSLVSILSHFFLLYIVYLIPLHEGIHIINSYIFLSLMVIILSFRVFLIYTKQKSSYNLLAELSLYLTGIWWSTALMFEFYYGKSFDIVHTVLLFIIVGITAGGALSMFKRKRIVLIYISILMIPAIISMHFFGKEMSNLLSGALVLFIGFNLVYSTKQNKIWINLQKNKALISKNSEKLKNINIELNKALKIAEEAGKSKSEFLANMSHEIRTPMNGIIGAADILKGMDLGKDEYKMVEIIHKSGNSLLTIINDILDFSKIEAGKMEIEYAPFNLLKSIEAVVDMLKHNASKKNLEFIYYIDSKIKHNVLGDETRINQVLINLLGNAIKFTEKGQVFLKIELINELEKYYSLKFSIEDTGIGIPNEKQTEIFESFTQANGSTTRKFGGTGLGTSISKMLVNLMGGEIGVISPNTNSNYGQGSIFYFTLKLKKDKLTPKTIIVNNEIKGKKALIIDDNETNCFVLSKMLNKWEIKTIETYSGKKALNILQNNNIFDLIFIDYNMPDKNGFDVIKMIKNKLITDSKKIMISSNSTDLTKAEAKKHGFDLLLYKPIKQSELYNAILNLYSKNIVINEKINQTPKYSFPNLNILIAEDNPINQKIALSVFKQVGLQAEVAANGQIALDMLKQKKYDIVFMDVQMPVIDGIKATNIMRANGDETIVVAMTANAMKGDRDMCINAGMNEYISKPFKKEDVYNILEKYY